LAKTNRSGFSPAQVGAQLDVDPHILSACLNANYYFDLSPDYQKKLIIKALGLKPTKKDAVDALAKAELAAKSWNSTIIQEIESLGWDAGYKEAYKLRRETGQEIKTLNADQPKLITQVAMGDKQILMTSIMATHKKTPLEKQEEKHKTKLKKLYEELGGIKALSESDKEEAEEQLENYRHVNQKMIQWTKADTAEANRLKTAKHNFETRVKEDTAALESLLEATEDLLAENKEKWVSTLTCPIPDESGYKMCPAIEPNWSQQQEEIAEVEARIKAVDERKFPEQKEWDELSEKATECKDRITHREILKKNIKELEEKLENAAPEEGEKKEALEISIAALEEKVEHLRLGQSAIIWNQATQETLDATQIKIEETETKREHYDDLCKLLAPDGIPGELVAEKLGGLNARLAEHAEMVGQEILFRDDLVLSQAKGKPLWVLGGSEMARARMAIAEALSHVSGINLVLLDELNISVFEDNERVRKWLMKIGKDGTQVIGAAATNAAEPPKIPENSPVRVFWVSGGQIKKL
jgi:predicted secreted protein